jgi:hypothetical protein
VTEQTPKTIEIPFPGFKVHHNKTERNKKSVSEASNMVQLAKKGLYINAKLIPNRKTQSISSLPSATKLLKPDSALSSSQKNI